MEKQTEAVWNLFSAQLRRFIFRHVSSMDAANDILQEAFLKIHAHLPELREKRKLQSWVYQIVRRTIIDHFREQNNRSRVMRKMAFQETAENDSGEPEISHCIEILINRLPARYRELIRLTEYLNITHREAGEKLGLSTSGAKSRAQRGRTILKTMLLSCCRKQLETYGIAISKLQPKCRSRRGFPSSRQ